MRTTTFVLLSREINIFSFTTSCNPINLSFEPPLLIQPVIQSTAMELLIENGYTRILYYTSEEFTIVTLSSSIVNAWQMLEKEKAFCRVKGIEQCKITVVNKEIEKKDVNIFLLMFRRYSHTKKEMIWMQSFENKPCSYLNIPLKLAT